MQPPEASPSFHVLVSVTPVAGAALTEQGRAGLTGDLAAAVAAVFRSHRLDLSEYAVQFVLPEPS